MDKFRERLKELRTEHKMTQKGLANALGTTNSSICDWECGRTEPSIDQILLLCALFDTSADYLLGLES